MPYYCAHYTNHPDGITHDGTTVLIKTNIKHHQANSYHREHIRATNIIVEDWISPITISSVYCPPKYHIVNEHFSIFLKTLGKRFVDGDFNAKHTPGNHA